MHIQRIHFDRVFDVQPHRGMFSFASDDAVTYSVHLPGRVIPREGATWAVAFEAPGDWSTLLGWRDLAAQRTTLNHRLHHVLSDVEMVYWFAIPALVLCVWFGGLWAALALLLASAAAGAWWLRKVIKRNRRVRAALRTG